MEKLLRVTDVCKRLDISRSALIKWIKDGAFPQPARLGNCEKGILVWNVEIIDQWQKDLFKGGVQ